MEGDGEPLNYEKFQLGLLSLGYDWTYFLDADAFIHPDTRIGSKWLAATSQW